VTTGAGAANERRLLVVKAEEQIKAKFKSVLTAATVALKVEECTKPRREATPEGTSRRAGLDREIQKLVDALASVGATAEISRGTEEHKAVLEHIDGQLPSAEVSHDFDIRTVRDAVGAVVEDWLWQLDRNPDMVGQVLGKLVVVRVRLTPRPCSDAWDRDAEVGYAGVLREANADLIEAMEASMRELKIKPVGAGRAALPSQFVVDGLPHDGPQPRPRSRASNAAKAPWRTCWRRSGSRR
jgi:hypothetical protein